MASSTKNWVSSQDSNSTDKKEDDSKDKEEE